MVAFEHGDDSDDDDDDDDWLIVTHVMFTHSNGEEVQCVSLLVAVIAEAVWCKASSAAAVYD